MAGLGFGNKIKAGFGISTPLHPPPWEELLMLRLYGFQLSQMDVFGDVYKLRVGDIIHCRK